jgi:hypothetical protein
MRRDAAWRDIMAMFEQVIQRLNALDQRIEKLDTPLPVPVRRPRLADVLPFRRPSP